MCLTSKQVYLREQLKKQEFLKNSGWMLADQCKEVIKNFGTQSQSLIKKILGMHNKNI